MTFDTIWPAFLTIVSRKPDDSHLCMNKAWVEYKHTETWQAASWRVVSQTSKLQTSIGSHNNSLLNTARPKMRPPPFGCYMYPRWVLLPQWHTTKCLPGKSIVTTKYILQQYLLKLPHYYRKAFPRVSCSVISVIVTYFFARWDWCKEGTIDEWLVTRKVHKIGYMNNVGNSNYFSVLKVM